MSFLKKKSFLFCALTGVAAAVLAMLIFLVPSAVLVNREVVGPDTVTILNGICSALSMLLSVRLVTIGRRKQAIPLGGSVFGIWLLFLYVIRLLAGADGNLYAWFLWICVPAAAGMILGVLSAGTGKKQRKSVKRRKVTAIRGR